MSLREHNESPLMSFPWFPGFLHPIPASRLLPVPCATNFFPPDFTKWQAADSVFVSCSSNFSAKLIAEMEVNKCASFPRVPLLVS